MQKWRVNKEQAHKVTSIKQLCKTMICGAHESHINRETVQGNMQYACMHMCTLQLKDFRASKMKTESPVKFLQNYPPEKRMTPTQMRKAKKKKWRKRKKRQWQRKKKKWRKRKKRQRQRKKI